jgi:hypothetical protein
MELRNAIFQTLKYFALFGWPLTAFEIYQNLWRTETTFREVLLCLEQLKDNGLSEMEGFYFLPGNERFVAERKARYLIAEKKIKQAKKYLRLLSCLPFIRAIFICNDVGYRNAGVESDIDLAIVTAKNKIWCARFFSTLIMAILRKRPTKKSRRDKLCLSFYISEENLNLEAAAYDDDIHFVYWLHQFTPITPDLSQGVCAANPWTRKYLPNASFPVSSPRIRIETSGFIQKILEFIFKPAFVEKFLKRLQLRVMPLGLLIKSMNGGKDVIITDKLLKLHDKDTRIAVRERWRRETT